MVVKVEVLTTRLSFTEGPFWDETSQSLYYVDVFDKGICKYTPSTGTCTRAVMPNSTDSTRSIAHIIPVEGQKDTFVIPYGSELIKVKWDGVSEELTTVETIVDLKTAEEEAAFWNDAKVDSKGQLWVGYNVPDPGTEQYFKKNAGGLYTLTSNKILKKQLSGISLANGMGWTGTDKYYFIDSLEDEVMEFDYNSASDEIKNKRIIFKCKSNGIGGIADGMTVDTKGNIWFAVFGGNKIVNIDPRKPDTILQTIEIPVQQVTSCTFGGPNLEELYVTTAGYAFDGSDHPDGGYLYRVTGLNVQGVPSKKIKL